MADQASSTQPAIQEFKLSADEGNRARRRLTIRLLTFNLIMATTLTIILVWQIIHAGRTDIIPIALIFPTILVAGFWQLRSQHRRLNRRLGSYRLFLEDNAITVRIDGSADIHITRQRVDRIEVTPRGDLILRTGN